jgi:hypothetical protein
MEGFRSIFAALEDPRAGNAQRHALHGILVIAHCTVLGRGEDCSDNAPFGRAKEPFLHTFLRLAHGIPSHDTFSTMLRLAQIQAGQATGASWHCSGIAGLAPRLQMCSRKEWPVRYPDLHSPE